MSMSDNSDDNYKKKFIDKKKYVYTVEDSKGKQITRIITVGSYSKKNRYDEEALDRAYNKVISMYKDELVGIKPIHLRRLVLEYYDKDNPLNYKHLKHDKIVDASRDSYPVKPEDHITKETVTIVNPHVIGGSSALLLAGSFSGKTTLMVQAVKNLLKNHKDRYDLIIIFSESISALPLNDLPLHDKIQIYPIFIPQLISFIMKVNQATNLRYSVLIILDDILKLKGEAIDKLLLVARNSGISTIICTQKIKGISPAARASVHNIYILGSRNSEEREQMINIFLRSHLRDLGLNKFSDQENWMRANTALGEDERKLIKINSIEDRMTVHTIKK